MLSKNFKMYKFEDKPKEFGHQLTDYIVEDGLDPFLKPFVKYNDSGVILVGENGKYALFIKSKDNSLIKTQKQGEETNG